MLARPSADLKSILANFKSRSFLPASITIAFMIASTAAESKPLADSCRASALSVLSASSFVAFLIP